MNLSMELRHTCLIVLYSAFKTRRKRQFLKSHTEKLSHSVYAFLLKRLFHQRNKKHVRYECIPADTCYKKSDHQQQVLTHNSSCVCVTWVASVGNKLKTHISTKRSTITTSIEMCVNLRHIPPPYQ
jgi:hypothetical protein